MAATFPVRRGLSALRATAVLLVLALASRPATGGRVVAVGDIHADLPAFRGILEVAALSDSGGAWVGGNATLVVTGDFLDRGPDYRGVMDYLQDLQADAQRKGGKVEVLLGNHEAMNLLGDLRYVTSQNFAQFAGDGEVGRQDAEWQELGRWSRARAERLAIDAPVPTGEDERAWRDAHPPGWFSQRDALGPEGEYGRWLRGLPAIVRIGDAAFLHGGISPGIAERTPEEIRDRVREEIGLWDRYREQLVAAGVIPRYATLQELFAAVTEERDLLLASGTGDPSRLQLLDAVLDSGNWYIQHPDGPLWFRGYAQWADGEGEESLAPILATSGIRSLVVGHSPTADHRIHRRFDGAVYLIDTGMLQSHYEGRASALEILDDGRITALYADGPIVLQPAGEAASPAPPRKQSAGTRYTGPEGEPLPFRTDDEVLEFLASADVVEQKRIKAGINQPFKLTLEKDGVRAHAVFRDVDEEKQVAYLGGRREMFFRDSFLFEPAAYELARMLGLDTVPPAALRRLGTTPGSVQLWVEQAMTEEKRLSDGISPPDLEGWNRSMQQVKVFDALILNTDRNAGNLLIDPAWSLWMIDHTRAFRRGKNLPEPPGFSIIDRGLFERLQQLDPGQVMERLQPFLRKHEINAILARRDAIVDYVESLVAARGEAMVLYESDGTR